MSNPFVFVVTPFTRRTIWLWVVLMFFVSFAQAVELPLLVGQAQEEGIPWQGPAAVREQVDQIMEREHGQSGQHHVHRIMRIGRPDFVGRMSKDNNFPDTAVWPIPAVGETGPTAPSSPQSTSINFTGATLSDTRAYPPDSMGTVGPAQYIVAVNGRIRTFNKTTGVADGVIDADTDVFFNSVMAPPTSSNFTSDPRIRYDRLSHRWFIIMIDVPGGQGTLPNRVMLAVSDGPVITGSTVWSFFYFQHDQVSPAGDTGEFADYPTLGVDANALYIGVNIFGGANNGTFKDTTAFVVRKSSILGAGPIVVSAFRGLIPSGGGPNGGGPYTPQGVDNFDPNATEGYIMAVSSSFYNRLVLRRISNPGGTPSISGNINISVPANGSTINVPHLGNTNGTAGYLDGLDYRLLAAHFRNGSLWTSENVAVDNTGATGGTDSRMGVRWYELTGIPTGQTPSVVQAGILYEPSASNSTTNRCYWMGTVMVSGQGHAAMGFSVAGANEHANAGTVGRLKNDTLGTMGTPVLYTASSSAYNPLDSNGNPINRWGDYSYTSLDPNDDMTMWTIQEFVNANNSYGVQVVKLLAPGPALPTNCSPNSVAVGVTNVAVTLSASSDGSTGFFDPGAGFSNRLAAVVNGGGVSLNSITFNNPTNLTLNLWVSNNATAGGRTITIINPDGQSVTSATAILTVTSTTNPAPIAAFIASATNGAVPLTVNFTNLSTGATNYSWNFGDGHTSTTTNAVNIYTNAGVYSVTLTAVGAGGTNSLTRASYIVVTNVPPSISTPPQSLTVGVGSNATFTVIAAGTLPLAYQWRFNTTNISGATSSSYTRTNAQLSDAGNYTVVVTNIAGSITSAPGVLTITSPPPVVVFVASVTNGISPLVVNFTNLSSGATNYSWSFGDGHTNTAANPTNTYTTQGSYTVTLTGFGPGGQTTLTRTNYIVLSNAPPVLGAIANRSMHVGTTLLITNTATDPDTAQTLTFSLDAGAPAGANMTTNGLFSWTPDNSFVNTTNNISARVADNGSPSLSDAKVFSVAVLPVPSLQSSAITTSTGGVFTLSWSSISGQTYRVQYSTNIADTNWFTLPPDVTATNSTASKSDSIQTDPQRFYRIFVLP